MSYRWYRHEKDNKVHQEVRYTECFVKLANVDAFGSEQNDNGCPIHTEILPAFEYIDEEEGDAPHNHKYDGDERNVVHNATDLSYTKYSSIKEEDAQLGECDLHRLRNCDNKFDLEIVRRRREDDHVYNR